MDLDLLLRQQDEDIDMRKRMAEYQKKIAALTPKPPDGGDDESSMSSASKDMARNAQFLALASTDPSGKSRSSVLSSGGRVSIMNRDFSASEPYRLSKTGKPLPVTNRPAFEQRANEKIIKTIRNRRKS
jgi:hypothetical protein